MKQVTPSYLKRKSWVKKIGDGRSRHYYLSIGSQLIGGEIRSGISVFNYRISSDNSSPMLTAENKCPSTRPTPSIRQQQKLLGPYGAGEGEILLGFHSAAYIASVDMSEAHEFDFGNFGKIMKNYKAGNIASNCEKLGLPRPGCIATAVYDRLKEKYEIILSGDFIQAGVVEQDEKYSALTAVEESLRAQIKELSAKERAIKEATAETRKQMYEVCSEMNGRKKEIIAAKIKEAMAELGA